MILPTYCSLLPSWKEGTTARALWVWHAAQIVENPARTRAFLAFLDAPRGDRTKPIRTIFLEIDPGADARGVTDPTRSVAVRAFLRAAHRRKVRVEYLCGDAKWALPENHPRAVGLVKAVLAFNAKGQPDARFDGFQFDVEPYLIKPWPSATTIAGYLALLDQASAAIRTSRQRLVFGAAIPFWWDSAELDGLHKRVIDRLDYVAVMDYVDSTDHFLDYGRAEIEYAASRGKKVWLGAETQPLPDEPTSTFYAKGNAAMESAFAAAAKTYEKNAGLAGFAIHWNESYPKLRP